MAPVTSELATLRALTFRLASTATSQLPQHVPAIAASLANCRSLLLLPQAAASRSSSESTVALHKYRTQLSTLLQDRTIQGRWAAIVLIKATIEIGGWEILQKSLPWVRGLLGILTKPDPPSSKKLSIITLTRIFMLTRDYPTLVREITTPSLPAFVQSGLQIATSKAPAPLLLVVLESFNELLPRHPTIFRTYLKQLTPLLASLIAPTPSSKLGEEQKSGQRFELTAGVIASAQQLYVQTSCSAPKGASSEEREKSLKATINNVHQVADKVFRAVIEDWQSSNRDAAINGHTLDDEMQDLESVNMALPAWAGLFAGSERLVHLLHLVQQYLALPTASSVGLNVSVVMDLVTRILSITVPGAGGKTHRDAATFNNQVSKEERDNLWLVLPDIHVAATEILLVLARRSQSSTLPLDSLIVDQLVWVFAAERDSVQIRSVCYRGIAAVLQRSGAGLSKVSINSLVPLMRTCCEDLLPFDSPVVTKPTLAQNKANGTTPSQTTANADTFLDSSKGIDATGKQFLGLEEAAYNLLPMLFANIRTQYLSDSMRGRLDRTAVLTQNKPAMLASVLNPPPSKRFGKPAASILPLMARSFPESADVEGFLRPRMPAIRLGRQDTEMADVGECEGENEGEEEEEEEDEKVQEVDKQSEAEAEAEDGDFVGHELDTLLQSASQTGIASKDFAMADGSNLSAEPSFTVDTITGATPAEAQVIGEAQAHAKDSGKRTQGEQAQSSPNKRAKFGENKQSISSRTRSSSAVEAPVGNHSDSTPVAPESSEFTASNTASVATELPEPGEAGAEGADSDEDDVVSLVMGQDTDEESE